MVKNLQCGRPGFSPWIEKVPPEKGMAMHSWTEALGEGYSPSGRKDSYTIERPTLSLFSQKIVKK